MKHGLTRREFLKIAASTAAVVALEPAVSGVLGAPARQETVTITMVESWFGVPQFQDSIAPVLEAINEKMQSEGVNVQIQSLILDDHETKYPVLYASGADFTMAFDAPWYKMDSLRDQGALAEIEGLVDSVGQNLKAEVTDKIYNANFQNGHLYGVPAAYYYSGTSGVEIRADLRKKYNAPEPTSQGGSASLEPFLQAIHDNEPSMIPYANTVSQSVIRDNVTLRREFTGGILNTGLVMPDAIKDTTFVELETIPEIIEAATLLRSWWEKDLVNKTDLPSSGQSQNAEVDFFYPGQTAAVAENEAEFKWVELQKQLKASIPDGEMMGYDLSGMRDGRVRGIGNLKQWNFIVFNVQAPPEQQEAGIKFFDWLTTSQDNMDLWLMGIDGVNYKKEDNLRFSEIEGVDATRNYRRQWYVSGLSGRFQRQPSDLPPEAEAALAFFSTESNWDFFQYEQFTPDTKALEAWTTQLNAVWEEAYHGLATGQTPVDESIAKMKATLDGAGRQELKAALQAQFDAYKAQQGS